MRRCEAFDGISQSVADGIIIVVVVVVANDVPNAVELCRLYRSCFLLTSTKQHPTIVTWLDDEKTRVFK